MIGSLRHCVVCGHDLGDLPRCPECGANAPLPAESGPGDSSEYWPTGRGLYRVGRWNYGLKAENGVSRIVPTPYTGGTLFISIAILASLAAVTWLVPLAATRVAPGWMWMVFRGFFALFALIIAVGAWCKAREGAAVVVDPSGKSMTCNHGAVIDTRRIERIEVVRFDLSSGRYTVGPLLELIAVLRDGDTRFARIELPAANVEQVGAQLARVLGVPFRTRRLGKISGRDYSVV